MLIPPVPYLFVYMITLKIMLCVQIKWLARKFILPKPGQGPSEATMDKVNYVREPNSV
jgi:hypothetical protein